MLIIKENLNFLMMKQINFIIAIATFNRVNNLKVVIDSILKQKLKKNVNLEVVISNSCSTDETSSFLESLKTNKQFHIHNKSEKIPNNTLSQFVNFENLSKTIPEHADWVWWLGDDDKLVNNNSVQCVVDTIMENDEDDLIFVHACSARRASKKKNKVKDLIFNLCQEYGYHEMLGWCSSIVMKGNAFKNILASSSSNKNYKDDETQKAVSCYIHSAQILKNYHDKLGIFLDYPLVDNQVFGQSEETIKRWNEENVPNRYFEIVSDIYELREFLPKKKFKPNFFRYHTYYIWDHLAHLCLIQLDNYITNLRTYTSGKVQIDDNFEQYIKSFPEQINKKWHQICQMTDLVDDQTTMKLLAYTFLSGINYTNMYLNSNGSEHIKKNYIDGYSDLVRKFPVFNFEIGSYQLSHN